MKILKIAGVSILALGLVLGLTLPALAAADSAPPRASDVPPKVFTLVGKVTEKGESSFDIETRRGEFTLSVDSDTKFFKVPPRPRPIPLTANRLELRQEQRLRPMPQQAPSLARNRPELTQDQQMVEPMGLLRRFCEEATFDDVTVGARVVVRAVRGEENPLAKVVLIIKPPAANRAIGTVTSISSGEQTITIAPADGSDAIILHYNERTLFILRGTPILEGEKALVIYVEEDDILLAKRVMTRVEPLELAD